MSTTTTRRTTTPTSVPASNPIVTSAAFDRHRSVRVVPLPDRFDVHEVEAFEAAIESSPGDVILDLGAVRFVDAAALRAVVRARARALSVGREVSIGRLSSAALVTLELTGLDEALPAATPIAESAA